jgi:branched-chain amino acid transport system substrate-binding protein
MISGGMPVNYVGATGVEMDAGGTANGSYAESEVIGGAFTTVKITNNKLKDRKKAHQ